MCALELPLPDAQPISCRRTVQARRRPAAGHRAAGRGRPCRPQPAGARRRDRQRQDQRHGLGRGAAAAAGPRPQPQQDPGGAAVRRVPAPAAEQRGRVFRQLLRLLPAGGLYRADRHVHREGLEPQRRHRSDAPCDDAGPADEARRAGGGERELHLRHRVGRGLHG